MSSPPPLKLVVITASVREGRFGPVVADWFLQHALGNERFETETIDLADIALPAALPADPHALASYDGRSGEMRALAERLAAAEAFVVVSPEYNHSFPAALKNFIDWHFIEWRAKPVAFVSYGGVGGGLRAVEQLRLVFAEMHAVGIRDQVSFHRYWEQFDDDGALRAPEEADSAAATLLDKLSWWALSLRRARAQIPYD